MEIPVFLSCPRPFLQCQKDFVERVTQYLQIRGFRARSLGVTDYDVSEPLTAIRRLMLESNGLLTIAFKRAFICQGTGRPQSDIGEADYDLSNQWITSPWCHIEPAMAYQIGLPILIFREKGVIADGVLERGVTGTYLPEFDLNEPTVDYLQSNEWKQLIGIWEGYVRSVVDKKGQPPRLF